MEIDPLSPGELAEVEPLLVDLQLAEQTHYDHPRLSAAEIRTQLLSPLRPTFRGENVVLGARDEGRLVGFCWIVLYDPGTGMEGELAELYVAPGHRGGGLGRALALRARQLLEERGVTFACVWSRPDNPAANSAYAAAGFRPSEQLVLTWLPLDEDAAPERATR